MALNLRTTKSATPPPTDDATATEPFVVDVPIPAPRPVLKRTAAPRSGHGSGFQLAAGPVHHRLIVSAEGEEKSGKNHFAFTAPGPIYMHSFDIGNEGVVQKFQKEKKIYIAEYELSMQPDEGTAKEVADAANDIWDQFMSNYRDGLASCGQGTTIVDTGTEMWELLRLARFGKLTQVMPHHYGPVNKEMQEAVREVFGFNCNALFLHKQKEEWENYTDSSGKEKGRKTGKKKRVGFSDMPFLVQMNIRCQRIDQEEGGSVFEIAIEDCRQNPDLNNTTMPNDFEMLLEQVFGS